MSWCGRHLQVARKQFQWRLVFRAPVDMNHANWIELAGIHGGLWLMTDANVVDVNSIFFCLKTGDICRISRRPERCILNVLVNRRCRNTWQRISIAIGTTRSSPRTSPFRASFLRRTSVTSHSWWIDWAPNSLHGTACPYRGVLGVLGCTF
jgi:hypothetical protein